MAPLISPMPGSALKRIFKLHHEGLDYALKWYPPVSVEETDPCQTEQRFYQFLKAANIHDNPFALGWDMDKRLSGHQSLAWTSHSLRRGQPTRVPFSVEGFWLESTRIVILKKPSSCRGIPLRESSVSSLLDAINTFILQGIPDSLREVQPLVSFWEDELNAGWQQIIQHCLTACSTGGLDPNVSLKDHMAWITPGEFTFHNTIITPEHSICFCDFDQARWGDPACMIARFFSQPDFLAKDEYLEPFLNEQDSVPGKDPLLAVRVRLVAPLIRIELLLQTLFPAISWELGDLIS